MANRRVRGGRPPVKQLATSGLTAARQYARIRADGSIVGSGPVSARVAAAKSNLEANLVFGLGTSVLGLDNVGPNPDLAALLLASGGVRTGTTLIHPKTKVGATIQRWAQLASTEAILCAAYVGLNTDFAKTIFATSIATRFGFTLKNTVQEALHRNDAPTPAAADVVVWDGDAKPSE